MSRKRRAESVKQKSSLTLILTDIRTIAVTIIAGLILAYIIQDARFAPKHSILGEPTHSVNLNLGNGNIKIPQGQMVILANENGVAIVRFIFSENGAAYQWRYKGYISENETTGSGTLYENYARTPTDNGTNLEDLGSSLIIIIEDIQATWSSTGGSSGWIYYKSLGVDVLDDATFNTIDLSTLQISK